MVGPLVTYNDVLSCIHVHTQVTMPNKCGHGCCGAHEQPRKNSLLGPEFNEFEDHPPILNTSFASLVSEISSIAWMRSGMQSSDANTLFQSVPPT